MFYGNLAERNPVNLRDTDEESFEEFLRFLYTEQFTLTPEIAVSVMYLAKKYMVPSLTEKCVALLRSSMKSENVFTVLEQAIHFDEKELQEKCWEVVEKQTSKAVTSAAFADINQATLSGLLKREPLNIAEVELFQAVLKWSDRQCLKNGLIEATGENKRAVVGEGIYEIRFLSMTEKEFAQYVHSSGMLTTEEIIQIYGKFNGLDSPGLKWKMSQRRQTVVNRFARCSVSDIEHHIGCTSVWAYGDESDSLSFSVNQHVTFHGVRLFGDVNGSRYEVTLEINGAKVSGTYTSEHNEGMNGFDVMLSKPISVDANKVVTMTATIKGPSSDYVNNGKTSVKVNEVTVTFSEATGSTNGTNVSQGQFYQIIIL